MPVVPIIHQEVDQQAFSVPTPKFATPVKEAYTGVADANVEIAGQLTKMAGGVADKVIQNNQWQEQARVYDARERLANDVTNLLTNSEEQTIVDADGKQYQVPSGYMNKSGFTTQLDGGSEAVRAKMMEMRDGYLDTFKDPRAKAQAARLLDGVVTTAHRQAANHEAQQVRKAVGDTFLASAMNEVHNATIASSPEDLAGSLGHIRESYTRYAAYNGMSPEQVTEKVSPMYAKAIQNSVLNVLHNTGDVDKATALLEKFRDVVPNDYEKISQTVEKQNDIMTKAVARQELVSKIDNEFSIIKDMSEPGAVSPTTLDIDHMSATGAVRSDFAVAYNSAKTAFEKEKLKPVKGSGLPMSLDLKDDSDQMEAFGQHMSNIMMSEDKQGVVNVLTEAMKDSAKGKLSQDKLKITMFYALQRGNFLESAMEGVKPVDPALLKLDGGMKSLLDWSAKSGIKDPQLYSDYMDAIKGNADPREAVKIAQQNQVLKADPSVASWDVVPTTIKKNRMTSAVSFPAGTKVYGRSYSETQDANTAR